MIWNKPGLVINGHSAMKTFMKTFFLQPSADRIVFQVSSKVYQIYIRKFLKNPDKNLFTLTDSCDNKYMFNNAAKDYLNSQLYKTVFNFQLSLLTQKLS